MIGLVRRRWPPLVGHSTNHILKALERFESVGPADFLRIADRDLGAIFTRLRSRDGDRKQDTLGALGCFGQRLRERELVVEGAACQVVAADEGSGIGHPLIDQDDRRRVFGQQFVKSISRVCPVAIGLGDDGVGLGTSELPGELAPDRVDMRTVVFRDTDGLKWLPTMATRLTCVPA